ncbi:MAG: hypothetical protein GC146_08785 [Limimaricola sp.]|uniref:glycosyltransferase family 29 protein n=1 Tax=Limimaricola sp. TaxID=2211665 RepID=UPI001D881078|nr:glycosyltransferase family 29 protein [Limimaricola sp.]MBI1417303.1 hypothetical protein [Limimaricola sp.]
MLPPRLRAWPRKYLWQAPRGWSLKLTRNSDARMRAAIAGKRVVVVGNARALLDTAQGQTIDGFDIVIRLNKGRVVNPTAQGARTDMVGLTPELSEDETVAAFEPQIFLMLIPKMRHFRLFRAENVARTLFYPWRSWMADRNLIGRRPSSGFMIVSWLVRLGVAREIALHGFDFGQTQTYYNPDGYKTPHNFAREGEIIRGWAEAGKITIIPPV